MARPLKAVRYAERASPTLIRIITERLPFVSFAEAHEIYASLVPNLEDHELALLGCNDRYFLLTGLLNRVDAIHPWLYDRCREVEAEPDGYLDLWARFHFKTSTITIAGSIQELACDPETRICIFSLTKTLARDYVNMIKEELENNDLLKTIYADVFWQDPGREAASWSLDRGLTVKRKGNYREASVEGHGVIDALPTGKHFPILKYDDPITERSVSNPEQIKKATERIQLSFNLGIGEKTRKRFIGTRYHFADSWAYLIEEGIAKPRIYPATDDGTLEGEPVFLSPSAWAEIKKEQRSTVAAQHLQNPLAGKENTFRTAWLTPYWLRPVVMNVYILGDPSRGRNKTSDRTALAVIGIDTQGNKYLLDGYCHRMHLSERWQRLRELHKKWTGMPGVQLVKVGYERYGAQSDDEYFDEKMRQEGRRFEIEEINWIGERGRESKTYRVERLEPDFRLGSFFVPGKVWHRDVEGHVARWSVPEGSDQLVYARHMPHEYERRAVAHGERWRLMDPLRRLDEDGNIYDLTRIFFEEFAFFPFSPHDDLIDAMSRVYDLDPMPAVKHERIEVFDYPDA